MIILKYKVKGMKLILLTLCIYLINSTTSNK